MSGLSHLPLSQWKLVLLAGDAAVYVFSVLAGLLLSPKTGPEPLQLLIAHKTAFLLMGVVYLVVLYIADLYDYQQDFRNWANLARVILSAWLGSLVVVLLFYFPLGVFVGRLVLVIQGSAFFLLLAGWRWGFSAIALPQRLQRQVLIMGAGKSGRRIWAAIRKRPGCGLGVVGFVDDDPRKAGAEIDGLPVLGDAEALQTVAEQYRVGLVVVAITHEKSPRLIQALSRIAWDGCQVMDMPSLFEFLAGKVPIEHISPAWIFLTSLNHNKFYYPHLKALIDLCLGTLGLLLLWPLLVIIALLIKLDSPGPVFFRQERLGRQGRPFQILKFRTMVRDAENHGPQWAEEEDPRVTRVGRLLRKLRLDEIPQLINVLKGEMSLVGPRPERGVFIRELKDKVPYYGYRLLVKPGLTGWAQVMYPYASSLNQSQEKLEYDIYYIKNLGFFLDLAILLKTVRIVLFGRGI